MKLLGLWLVLRLANALWPIPSKLTTGTSVLWIDKRVKVTYHGLSHEGTVQLQSVELPSLLLTDETFIHRPVLPIQGSSTTITSQQIVQHAVDRLYESIFAKSFIPWKFHPRNSDFEPSTKDKSFITSIVLKQTDVDIAKISNPDIGEVDESYILTLSDDGVAVITAKSSIGLSRGLTTFSQLFFKHSDGGSYTALAPVEIEDAPKFPYRGINMDVSRNYYPVSDIKRMVDAMAFNKLNQLHLHVTDGQSWPIEIPSLPELAAKGAYNRALTYSPRDLEEIQTYGALLGVAVTLEIDMPGHTSAIWHSHPELIAAFNVQPDWDTYCAEPPCGTLKLNSSEVYDFLDKLWADLLPRVSPYTSYFHTGGDEVKPAAYTKDETVGTDDLKVLQPLLQKLIDFNHDKVRQAGLTPVVWEEMLLQWNLTLGKDVIIQTWRSDAAVAEAVQKGYKTLAGNFHYWYLDCGKGQWLDFRRGTSSSHYYPYDDYCAPYHNWRLMYSYDPLQGLPPSSSPNLVLGGEAHIWSEQTDPINVDRMTWPRACAAAEVLWSGAKDDLGRNRSHVEASPRLSEMRERLVARGVGAEPVQMVFCTQEVGSCVL